MKRLSGGKGVQIIGLKGKESLRAVLLSVGAQVTIKGMFRNKVKTLISEERHLAQRARRGSPAGQISNITLAPYPEN
jgi:topoisomerase-4 subunit A